MSIATAALKKNRELMRMNFRPSCSSPGKRDALSLSPRPPAAA